MLAKVNSLPFITSILKDKTHMFRWKDFGSSSQIPTPPRQGSNPPLARSLLGVNVEGSDCSAHYAAISNSFSISRARVIWCGVGYKTAVMKQKYFSLLIIEIRHFRAHSVHLCNPQEHSSRQFFKNSWQKDSERRRRNFSLICVIWKGLGKIIISIHCNLLRSNR